MRYIQRISAQNTWLDSAVYRTEHAGRATGDQREFTARRSQARSWGEVACSWMQKKAFMKSKRLFYRLLVVYLPLSPRKAHVQ
jgi:hypothetical protein